MSFKKAVEEIEQLEARIAELEKARQEDDRLWNSQAREQAERVASLDKDVDAWKAGHALIGEQLGFEQRENARLREALRAAVARDVGWLTGAKRALEATRQDTQETRRSSNVEQPSHTGKDDGSSPSAAKLTVQGDAEERAFWVTKFKNWVRCQMGGSTWDIRKADGFRDCIQAMEANDRWMPADSKDPAQGDDEK